MKIIELTSADTGKIIYVNADQIETFGASAEGGSYMYIARGLFAVREEPSAILARIAHADML